MKKLTFKQACNLSYGDILYHRQNKNVDGSSQKWKVNGKVKRWSRNIKRIYIPLKHGLYSYNFISEVDFNNGICSLFSLEGE